MKQYLSILALFILSFIFKANAQIDYEAFKGEKVDTAIELNLKNVFFKEYGNQDFDRVEEFIVKNNSKTKNSPESVLHSFYSVSNIKEYRSLFKDKPIKISSEDLENRKLSDTLVNKIRLIHRLTFEHNGSPIAFLKYKKFKDSLAYSTGLLVLRKQKTVDQWNIVSQSDFPGTAYAIRRLRSIAFWQFFNRHNEEGYPKINKYKPLVQDADGILDIEKLGVVLKKNTEALSKFFD